MVLFLIVLLLVSIVGMLAMISAKQYELSTGHMLFANSRPALSRFGSRTVFMFGTALPAFVRYEARRGYRAVSAFLHRTAARAVVKFEHVLERVLHTVREKTSTERTPGEASAFLREVGEYKKKLTDSMPDNRIDQE